MSNRKKMKVQSPPAEGESIGDPSLRTVAQEEKTREQQFSRPNTKDPLHEFLAGPLVVCLPSVCTLQSKGPYQAATKRQQILVFSGNRSKAAKSVLRHPCHIQRSYLPSSLAIRSYTESATHQAPYRTCIFRPYLGIVPVPSSGFASAMRMSGWGGGGSRLEDHPQPHGRPAQRGRRIWPAAQQADLRLRPFWMPFLSYSRAGA